MSYERITEGKHRIAITSRTFSAKPPREDVKYFSKYFNPHATTISKFAELVSSLSPAYSPATFTDNHRHNDNWQGQSLFCLDFDSGYSKQDALDRFNEFNIVPNVYYTSYSHTSEKPRFRICLFLDQLVTDYTDFTEISKKLLKLFPDADQNCKDGARFFYGGNDAEVLNDKEISYDRLVDALCINSIGDDEQHVARHLLTSMEKNGTPINNNIGNPNYSKPSLFNYRCSKGAWQGALRGVKILRDFDQGEWLHHMQLLGLATNLIPLNGKFKWMKEKMKEFNESNKGVLVNGKPKQYNQNNFNMLSYVKKRRLHPMQLANFSPYEEDHEQGTITYSCVFPRGYVEVIEESEQMPLEEAELLLNHHVNEAVETGDTKIHIIKLPTGLGKTKRLETLQQQALFAFPTHALKDEFQTRLKDQKLATPQLPAFEDDCINNQIDQYFRIGAHKHVHRLINNIRNDYGNYLNKDNAAAHNYLDQMYACYGTKETVLTTHQKALYGDWKHDTVIFDEDPLRTLISIDEIKLSDLAVLAFWDKTCERIFEAFKEADMHQYLKTPMLNIDVDKLINHLVEINNNHSNLIDLISSDFFLKSEVKDKKGTTDIVIHFVKKNELPIDKKIIILSATAPVELYELLYPKRVQSVDISNVQQQGKIIQYTDRSYSQTSLKNHLKEAVEKVDDLPVITYARFKKDFPTAIREIHLWNCQGYDGFKGKDLAVLGTPHLPPQVYIFYALVAGLDIKTTDSITCHTSIEWKGMRFNFASFENSDLRSIQCSLIESELVQAVGRSRTLRTGATVKLYSNFPIQNATEIRDSKNNIYKKTG